MVRKILMGVAAVLAVLAIVVAVQPSRFEVARSTLVAAPAEAVFPHVNDFHAWQAWSPWEGLDPDMQRTFEGPSQGEGAQYAWVGNGNVGSGRMTVLENEENARIRIQLDFLEPFASTAFTEFTFVPEGEQTRVTWSMSGENNFIAKAMHMVMDVDGMIGTAYEQGLAELKAISEGAVRN